MFNVQNGVDGYFTSLFLLSFSFKLCAGISILFVYLFVSLKLCALKAHQFVYLYISLEFCAGILCHFVCFFVF